MKTYFVSYEIIEYGKCICKSNVMYQAEKFNLDKLRELLDNESNKNNSSGDCKTHIVSICKI